MSNQKVGTLNLQELFKKDLIIPKFQRPYSWNEEQVEQLLLDLIEANKNQKKYLIGNAIFYENNSKLEIIDGQQRITTLALIFKVLDKNIVNFLNNEINPLSAKNLKQNHQIINKFLEKENLDLNFLKNNVFITYINTNDLDEAFVLFDSQNTRGKSLERKDILKVHHLHPIKNNRTIYAQKWEKWEKEEKNYLNHILYLLSLIRKSIRGELKPNHLENIDVFKELKLSFFVDDEFQFNKLNNYNQPPIFERFDFDFEKNLLTLITHPIRKKGEDFVDGYKYLPFEINSSIESGDNFFSFIWKYFEIYKILKTNNIFTKLDNISGSGNIFLSKIYKASLFFYYDKFGNENLELFSKKVFILLAYVRITKHQIKKERVAKFEWSDKRFDIFKTILLSYSSKEVIKKIENYIKFYLDTEKFKQEIKGTKLHFINKYEGALNELY